MSDHIERVKLDDYVEQALPAAERRMVEAHVTACPVCQARLAESKQMAALLYGLPRENPAPNLGARINAAVAAQRASRRVSPLWVRLGMPVSFALGLLLLGMTASQWFGWAGSLAAAQWPDQVMWGWLTSLFTDPVAVWDSLLAFIEQALIGSAEEMDVLITLAVIALTAASLMGLAQLLSGERPRTMTPRASA